MLGIAGLFYAMALVELFGVLDAPGRIVVTAVGASFIATGAWQFAVMPAAGIAWVVFLCGGSAVGLVLRYGAEFSVIASLLLVYAVYLVSAVLVASRRFVGGLMAETAIERQREVVGLLLRDFEDHARDWLWEVDASGRLRHVSERMAASVGDAVANLLGRELLSVLGERLPLGDAEAADALARLAKHLRSRSPFSAVAVAAYGGDGLRWWSLTAKPLHGQDGAFEGWRGVSSDITAARQSEATMRHLANIDGLTGLANRHRFGQALQECFAPANALERGCTLVMLDLDNFKHVNDTLGHLAGDQLLCEVARRLRSVTPDHALLARLGGDEFAWVVPQGLGRTDAEALARRVREALSEPWLHEEQLMHVAASLGVANAPTDGGSPVELQRATDLALYAAKASGRDQLCFYDASMDEDARRRIQLRGDLRRGMERQEFRVVYQPQVRFSDGELVGFEALVRWQHPTRGNVPPAEFIPLAEESGAVVALGAWVLEQACRDAISWPAPLRVAVNVSSVQIDRSDLLSTVRSALACSGLPVTRLELELTESALMQDGDAAIDVIKSLRELGVRIALDDFGTGYSSLSYLQRLPIDKLKIDRSFVLAASAQATARDEARDARAILRAIVHLAQALNLDTIAEGVETAEMSAMLETVGCRHAQGYHYGRPMEAAQVLVCLSQRPAVTAEHR
jgi:diguanylate cyclase (GGDEF)-like protein